MTILLIEGVVATGKTTLLAELQHTQLWREHPTKLILSEHYTERVLELTRPTTAMRLALLDNYVAMMESLQQIWSKSRFKQKNAVAPLTICERFHLTHAAQVADFALFSGIEDRLCQLGATVVFLHHSPRQLLGRIKATEEYRGAMWRNWLKSIGDDDAITEYFLSLQTKSAAFFEASRLKKIAVEAHSATPSVLAAQIAQALLSVS